jgi:hypothetical protein
MSSQAEYPGTATSEGWTNVAYVKTSNNLRAFYECPAGDIATGYIFCSNFGFTVPDGATIDSIYVYAEGRTSPSVWVDSYAGLIVDGSSLPVADKLSSSTWSTTDGTVQIGGTPSSWGDGSLTATDINKSNFGVAVRFVPAMFAIVEIDSVRMLVNYTESGATINESVTFALELSDAVVSDLGGTTYNDSVTFALELSDSASAPQDFIDSVTFALSVSNFNGHADEDAAIRLISGTNDICVRWQNVYSMVESWTRDYQRNKYADGHNSIYLLSAWRKTWKLYLLPNDSTKTFCTTLRSETGNIQLFPLYKYDKSTHYKTRVDNRIPLNYFAGEGDAEAMLQVILYEVA